MLNLDTLEKQTKHFVSAKPDTGVFVQWSWRCVSLATHEAKKNTKGFSKYPFLFLNINGINLKMHSPINHKYPYRAQTIL